MSTTIATPYTFENAQICDLQPCDLVLADPVYGAEEVVEIEQKSIIDAKVLGQETVYFLTLKRPFRGVDGGTRVVARFPFEACVRIPRTEPDAEEGESASANTDSPSGSKL